MLQSVFPMCLSMILSVRFIVVRIPLRAPCYPCQESLLFRPRRVWILVSI